MKRIIPILLCTCLLAACGDNRTDDETAATDTTDVTREHVTTATPDTSTMVAPPDNTGAGTNTASSGTNTGVGARAGASGTTGNSGTSNMDRPAAGRTRAENRSDLEKTGQYDGTKGVPEPPNLDDAKFRNKKPAHTFGDTSAQARP